MKKIIAFVLVMLFVLTGCGSNVAKAQFYAPMCWYDSADYEHEEYNYGTVLTGEEVEKYKDSFAKVCEFAGYEKEFPVIVEVSKDILAKMMNASPEDVYAAFVRPNKIFVTSDVNEQQLIHEMLHYMSTDGEVVTRGLIYEKEGYEMGRFLNEGITDYFSFLLCNLSPLVECPYEYERYVAECLTTLVGMDEMKNAYFNADVSAIREKVNETLKDVYKAEIDQNGILLDQFDIFTTSLSGYSVCLTFDEFPDIILMAINAMNSVEEMIVKMSQILEMEDEIKAKQKDFLKAYPHIDAVTEFRKMW